MRLHAVWRRAGRRVLLKTRHVAARLGERLRSPFRSRVRTISLETVSRRLELVLAALYGRSIPVTPVERAPWTRERVRRLTRDLAPPSDSMPRVVGETIRLPPELSIAGDRDGTIARYRLLAIEQAERIARATGGHPSARMLDDRLEQDLYLLREGAAIDAAIAQRHPGMVDVLRSEREAALARRPNIGRLTPTERQVELLLRESLGAPLEDAIASSTSSDPDASVAWARATAEGMRGADTRYRGLPLASLWGTTSFPSDASDHDGGRSAKSQSPKRLISIGIGSQRTPSSDGSKGTSQPTSSNTGSRSDADASPRDGESDRATTDGEGDIDDSDDSAEAQGTARGIAAASATFGRPLTEPRDRAGSEALPPPIPYDEWDADAGRYLKRVALVRLSEAVEGEERWSLDMLQRHGALVRQVRQQFERLRARRALLTRQRSGNELDIDACVDAIVERRAGRSPSDRLYLDARPARRGLAISLLVDVSGSTAARVSDDCRIVDLERIALLIASEALDALGDLFAIHTFAGRDATDVRLTMIKGFGERSGERVRRRIAALEPGGFTRLGAAVRHATRELARQSAGHRLLLLLSDGRPNDVDRYQGPYGVEDSRQAIFEARASGVYPFCLTVDRDASEYLPRIFGTAGHTILQRPGQLPTALVTVVRALIRRR
jgi:nitric oxide reductase NorD protein